MSAITLCAAICTRDRPRQLARALDSLLAQGEPPERLLVVDNAPATSAARDLIGQRFPTVSYVREPVPGLDFARNRALRESREEIVAFLDDDAVADPDWVAATRAVFAGGDEVAVCMGRVTALEPETEGQRLFEANGGFARGERTIRLPRDAGRVPLIARAIGVGSGCSMALRRETALALGGFDEALDMGPALPGGGDLDLLWRLLAAGHELVYEPSVGARHEHRREVEAAIEQIAEHNRSLIAVLTKSAAAARGSTRWGILAFLAWRLVKPGLRLLRRAAGRDPLPARALLRVGGACWRGLTTYPEARRLARRRAAEARHR